MTRIATPSLERLVLVRIEQLEYLAAVTQHGSLRRASEQLHLSQSALSEAIRGLERELGVSLLERHRSGARISHEGRDLLPIMGEILSGIGRLKEAANDQNRVSRMIRVGTVNAGTSAILVPAVQDFGRRHATTTVDVATMFQTVIQESLLEGRLEIGLVNIFPGDEVPLALKVTTLLEGEAVVCCHTDDPLASQDEISIDDLRRRPFVSSRVGYVMHRLSQRLFGAQEPPTTYYADGAEMAKSLVAKGVGPSLLPDYSIAGDPLEEAGIITARPLSVPTPRVSMLLLRRQFDRLPPDIAELEETLIRIARSHPQGHLPGSATSDLPSSSRVLPRTDDGVNQQRTSRPEGLGGPRP